MTRDILKDTLEELKRELSGAAGQDAIPTADSEAGARVARLVQMVEQQLEYPNRDAEIDTLLEEVKEYAAQFMSKHPQLDAAFRQVIAMLGNLGI